MNAQELSQTALDSAICDLFCLVGGQSTKHVDGEHILPIMLFNDETRTVALVDVGLKVIAIAPTRSYLDQTIFFKECGHSWAVQNNCLASLSLPL